MSDADAKVSYLSSPPPQGTIERVPSHDGGSIRCVHAGEGPGVVMAHGYLLDCTVFNLVFDALVRAGHRVIAFDQRGHGESHAGSAGYTSSAAATDYRTVLDHFDVRDGVLVAHSMGAFLAIVFCLQHSDRARERLSRLVLLGGNAGDVQVGSLQNRLQIPMIKSGLVGPLWRYGPTGRAFMRQLFGRAADAQQVEATREIVVRQRVELSLPLLQAMLRESYYARLSEVPLPASVLCGEGDRTCPRWHSERLGREIPGSTNSWIDGAGHMLSYEAPEAVVAAVTGAAT